MRATQRWACRYAKCSEGSYLRSRPRADADLEPKDQRAARLSSTRFIARSAASATGASAGLPTRSIIFRVSIAETIVLRSRSCTTRLHGRRSPSWASAANARCANCGLQAPMIAYGRKDAPTFSRSVFVTSISYRTPKPCSASSSLIRAIAFRVRQLGCHRAWQLVFFASIMAGYPS